MMIDIFGSKVLQEAIHNIYSQDKINQEVISSTLESQFATSLTLSISKSESLENEHKQIVKDDFRKTFRLNQNRGDVLIVDFLSERNNIIEYNNSKLTSNTEVRTYLTDETTRNVILDSRVKSIPSLMERFIEIADSYKKVIIVELYLTNHNIDNNNMLGLNPNQYGINKVNALLKTFYDQLKFNKNEYNFVTLNDIYSEKNSNGRVSPWIYSKLSSKSLSDALTDLIE